MRTFDRHARRNINFDDFIQACVMLKTLTDKFRAKDLQQNGTIRISYEEVKESYNALGAKGLSCIHLSAGSKIKVHH